MTQDDELAQALAPVALWFRSLGIRYYIGGSIASSFHGAMRSTMDVDLVAELKSSHVEGLLAELGSKYYVSDLAIRDAIDRHSSFNLIHLATSFKVDVFVSKGRPFDLSAFERSRTERLGLSESDLEVQMASVEDVIIAKLLWYREGNEISERQWDDLNRLVKLRQTSLDRCYLRTFCKELNVDDLLERLLIQATDEI